MNKFFTFLMIIILMPINVVQAQNDDRQLMQYDVYAGGIHALKSKLDINLSGSEKYNLSLEAKTYGMLGKLAPWSGKFETTGWQTKTGFQPQTHTATTTWRNEDEVKTYKYKKDGSFISYSKKEDGKDGSPQKIDQNLAERTIDVLTATLKTLETVTLNNKCEGSSEVFDGKRRYKLLFKEKRQTTLQSSRYNVYSGPAIECTAEVQPIAGKWREKPRGWMSIQEQGRAKGTMPTVWFASVSEGQPAVPVKIRVKTDYGTLFMHLTQYQNGNKKLALK